jgi:hypothetical protein
LKILVAARILMSFTRRRTRIARSALNLERVEPAGATTSILEMPIETMSTTAQGEQR